MVMDQEVAGDDGMTNASSCSIEADFMGMSERSRSVKGVMNPERLKPYDQELAGHQCLQLYSLG